jgi:hypothetical protein
MMCDWKNPQPCPGILHLGCSEVNVKSFAHGRPQFAVPIERTAEFSAPQTL